MKLSSVFKENLNWTNDVAKVGSAATHTISKAIRGRSTLAGTFGVAAGVGISLLGILFLATAYTGDVLRNLTKALSPKRDMA